MEIKEQTKEARIGWSDIFDKMLAQTIDLERPGNGSPFQAFRMWKIINNELVPHIKVNDVWVEEKKI